MKVNGLVTDLRGAERVTRARRELIQSGDASRPYRDPVARLARELHPEVTHVVVTGVRDCSPIAKTITFEAAEGEVLPPFQAGQYCSLDVKVGPTRTSRPYSISSAPCQARTATTDGSPYTGRPYFELTVRRGRPGQGFVSNWLYSFTRVGDRFDAHLPFGQFCYEPLRDARHVVALAGGSGITPFMSMAAEIVRGGMDADLTILHGSLTPKDAIGMAELAALEQASGGRVRVVHVYSGAEEDVLLDGAPVGYEAGFLSAELVRRYAPEDPALGGVSFFVCGPRVLYEYEREQLAELGVPGRRIRMEIVGAPQDIRNAGGYPQEASRQAPRRFSLTVRRGLEEDVVPALSTEPLAVAMERARIPNHTRCRSGACGWCRCRLVSGEVFVPADTDGRRLADNQLGYVHACSTYPLGDCVIEVPIV